MYAWHPVCRHLGLIFKILVVPPISFHNYSKIKCWDSENADTSLEPVGPERQQHKTHKVEQTITHAFNKLHHFNFVST